MRMVIAAADLPTVYHVLSDINIRPVAAQLPVLDDIQYLDLTSSGFIEQVNVLNALKQAGIMISPEIPPELSIPVPVLDALYPSTADFTQAITLQVQGANFVNGSVINFGGKSCVTTFSDTTSLSTADLSNLDLAPPGNYPVFVVNPGGQTSNVLNFVSTGPS
jgi:hypothetical protein